MRHRSIGFDRILDTDEPVVGALPGVLPGPLPGPLPGAAADEAVRIRWHAAAAPPPEQRPVWTRVDDTLWFDPPGVARYRCTADAIEVTPIAGAPRAEVDALLIATALPAVMWLQGDIVLHAAAVVPPGGTRALAIAGPSGSGKSRLAAALVATGARLVGDDSIAVRGSVCAGLAGGYHLGARGAAERPFHPVARSRRAAPLGAVIVLGDARAPCERLTGVAAVEALLANRHRASVPRLCGGDARVLGDMARLARDVQVFRWSTSDADMMLDGAIRAELIEEGTQ